MVTRIRSGLPPSTFEQSAWARSSARQAETSLLASSRTCAIAEAQAASAQPIAPLPTRYLPAWRKSLSDERESPHGMSVLEAVILTSVLLAGAAMAVWFFVAAGSPIPNQ